MRDRKREKTQTVAGKDATADKQTKYPFLFGDGGWHTDGPVVVGKYTQTRQRRLRAKTVKSDHGRHYKKRPWSLTKRRTTTTGTITEE